MLMCFRTHKEPPHFSVEALICLLNVGMRSSNYFMVALKMLALSAVR